MSKFVLRIAVVFLVGVEFLHGQNTQVHPKPSDLADALQTISVVLNRIDASLSILSNRFDSPQVSDAAHSMRLQIRGIASDWSSVIAVSRGAESPTASDLFTIYTGLLDVQSFATDLTREERFRGEAASLAKNAAVVIRGQTDLIPILETLKYALGDKIDAEEASCVKRSNVSKH